MSDEQKTNYQFLTEFFKGRDLEAFNLMIAYVADFGLKRHRDAAQEATQEAQAKLDELEASLNSLADMNLPEAALLAARSGIESAMASHRITISNALKSVIAEELSDGPYSVYLEAAKGKKSGPGRSSSSYWSGRPKYAWFAQGKTDKERKDWLREMKVPDASLALVKSDTFTAEQWAHVKGAANYGNPNVIHVIAQQVDGKFKYVCDIGPQNSPNAAVQGMRKMLGLNLAVAVGVHGTNWDKASSMAEVPIEKLLADISQ